MFIMNIQIVFIIQRLHNEQTGKYLLLIWSINSTVIPNPTRTRVIHSLLDIFYDLGSSSSFNFLLIIPYKLLFYLIFREFQWQWKYTETNVVSVLLVKIALSSNFKMKKIFLVKIAVIAESSM